MASSGIVYNIQRLSTEDGPGIRTTVFFKGCPLRCLWCSNPESQSLTPQVLIFGKLCTNCGQCVPHCPQGAIVDMCNDKGTFKGRDLSLCTECGQCVPYCSFKAREISGKTLTVEEVMKEVRKDEAFYRNSGGGVTFGGGECTLQGTFLLGLMDACIQDCLHICVDTCGYCNEDLFRKVMDRADMFLYDLKHMDSETHKELTGVSNTLILRNLSTLLSEHPEKAVVRMPLMPGLNDGEENIKAMADFLLPFGCSSVEVMPCHSFGYSKYEACGRPIPGMAQYTPEALDSVLKRFSQYGLSTSLA